MKQKAITLLIISLLLATPLTASAAVQKTVTVDEVKARAAEATGKEVVVKLRRGTKIMVGNKAFPFEFTRDASLSGKIREARAEDFTLSSTSSRTGEVMAVISYADVLSIKRPSGFAKALKNVGRYSLIGTMMPALIPLYGILALMGRLPSC
jgi:hypothetical protein